MTTFFGLQVDANSLLGMSLPLALAALLAGAVGLERELHGHPAGLRTHMLVGIGSALITVVSAQLTGPTGTRGDPARLSAQIVTGIGFLGAGAIIREGATIRGLTTAASIWATAAIGIAAGAGPRLGQLAVVATGVVLFVLWIVDKFEDRLEARTGRTRVLEVHLYETEHAASNVLARIAAHKVVVRGIEYSAGKDARTRQMLMRIQTPKEFDLSAFISDLGDEHGVVSVSM